MKEVRVKVIPGARKESMTQGRDGRLIVAVRAARKNGKANARTTELLAAYYAVPLVHVHLVRGQTQSSKIFSIT